MKYDTFDPMDVLYEYEERYENARRENARTTKIIEAELGKLNEDRFVAGK